MVQSPMIGFKERLTGDLERRERGVPCVISVLLSRLPVRIPIEAGLQEEEGSGPVHRCIQEEPRAAGQQRIMRCAPSCDG